MRVAPDLVETEEDVLQIWDIHEKAFRAFIASATQWRWVALATMERSRVFRTGLDYQAVDVVMRRRGIRDKKGRVFADLQVIESGALGAFAEVAS